MDIFHWAMTLVGGGGNGAEGGIDGDNGLCIVAAVGCLDFLFLVAFVSKMDFSFEKCVAIMVCK